ncbi:MAG: glycine--tRNA ligase subunit beta [Elusimicrobiota bacterium]|jgi:glycyl-tRNA synthetase beta chain
MKRQDFILEIGVEPLPARFVRPALEGLEASFKAMLERTRLGVSSVRVLGTMRRLVVICDETADRSESQTRAVQGPPARLLKDAEGRFTPQAEGFARKNGVGPEDLVVAQTPKGEFLSVTVTDKGESSQDILSRELPVLIASLKFAKAMEWESSRFFFGRPIRSLLALHGRKVVLFSVAGVSSGRCVLVAPGSGRKPVRVPDAGRYLAALRDMTVLVDPAERRSLLVKRMAAAAKSVGGALDADEALLDETVFMTEHPVPVAGTFRREFLDLPPGLIKTVLKKQMYSFPLMQGHQAPEGRSSASAGGGQTQGKGLVPAFIAVRDGVSEGQKEVREGYEGVLEARLEDAAFYLARDLKTRLEDKLPTLARVSFQKGLGSMADKASRVRELALWICSQLEQSGAGAPGLDRGVVETISRLAYADLVCEVIREFPELQGGMGAFYAGRDGHGPAVTAGIAEFYQPLGPNAPVPSVLEGAVASAAAKLDNLACHFAVGNIPTAAADPFALRRQALGLLRIVSEKGLKLDLAEALSLAVSLVPVEESKRSAALPALREFVLGRAVAFFEEAGFPSDSVRSIRETILADATAAAGRLKAIEGMRKDPSFADLCGAFKRAANILKSAKLPPGGAAAENLRSLLKEPAELALLDELERLEAAVPAAAASGDFGAGLRSLAGVKPSLDRFFEDVMVMAEDPGLRGARLALLARLTACFRSVADLAEIAGPKG